MARGEDDRRLGVRVLHVPLIPTPGANFGLPNGIRGPSNFTLTLTYCASHDMHEDGFVMPCISLSIFSSDGKSSCLIERCDQRDK